MKTFTRLFADCYLASLPACLGLLGLLYAVFFNAYASAEPLNVSLATYYWATQVESATTDQNNNLILLREDPATVLKTTYHGSTFTLKISGKKWVADLQVSYQDASDKQAIIVTPYGQIPLVLAAETTTTELWLGRRYAYSVAELDVYIGARYVSSDSISRTPYGETQSRQEWFEPLLAAESRIDVDRKTRVFWRMSVGDQFSGNPRLSYDLSAGVVHEFNRHYSIIGGYRQQELSDKDHGVQMKSKTHGPFVAFAASTSL